MTEAQKFIRARQSDPALTGGVDSVVSVWKIVAPEMPPWMASMLASGQLAIGKLHEPQAQAITEVQDDASIAIGISAGFFDWIYSFAKIIAALQTVHGNREIVPPSLTRPQAIDELRRLFKLFGDGGHVIRGNYPIHLQQQSIAEEMATFAELLVLAHELGHVAGLTNNGLEEEADADRFAGRLILAAGKRIGYRMSLAGAFFGFRVYKLLERFGFSFDHSHPPATERLTWFVEEARVHFGGRAVMMAKLSITVAFDEFIESLENEALGKGTVTEQTELRVGVRLRAMLEEAARGRLPIAKFPIELTAGFKDAPANLVINALGEYVEDVASGAIAPVSIDPASLLRAVSLLTEPLKTTFHEGLRKAGVIIP